MPTIQHKIGQRATEMIEDLVLRSILNQDRDNSRHKGGKPTASFPTDSARKNTRDHNWPKGLA